MIKTTAADQAIRKCRICAVLQLQTIYLLLGKKDARVIWYTYSGMYVPKIVKNKRCTEKVHLLDHITLKREHEPIT